MIIDRLDLFEGRLLSQSQPEIQVTPSRQSNNQPPLSPPSSSLSTHLLATDAIQKLAQLRKIQSDLHTTIAASMKDFQVSLDSAASLLITTCRPPDDVDTVSRIPLHSALNDLGDTSETLEYRLNTLQSTLNILRVDLTRGVRVTMADMRPIRTGLADLARDVNVFCQVQVVQSKATCKSVWEMELQRIVDEQQFVKDQEVFGGELVHNLESLDELVRAIETVVDAVQSHKSATSTTSGHLNDTESGRTDSGVHRISNRPLIVMQVMSAHLVKSIGIQNVLAELQFKSADLSNGSERRISALHQMEITRPLLQHSRKGISQFEKELGECVTLDRVQRRHLLLQDVEQERQKRDKECLYLICGSINTKKEEE
ncbi:hypothetical protein BSLG_010057 [Batrachochytrium salamandrivorans]|nr:hypothetical protein BSLG_010057 [Batrachochytrium salamandrivorans]